MQFMRGTVSRRRWHEPRDRQLGRAVFDERRQPSKFKVRVFPTQAPEELDGSAFVNGLPEQAMDVDLSQAGLGGFPFAELALAGRLDPGPNGEVGDLRHRASASRRRPVLGLITVDVEHVPQQ